MSARASNGNGSPKLLDRRSDRRKVQVVYFDAIYVPESLGGTRIHIGETCDNLKRLDQHRKPTKGVEFPVERLCAIRASASDEKRLHRYFDGHRLENEREIFWPDVELVDYIRWLRNQYFAWCPDDEQCVPVEDMPTENRSIS